MSTTNCPSREELFGCLVGTLFEDEAEGVLEHIGSCSRCQETMQTLNEAEDTLMARLRCAGGKDPYADEPEREQMLARIRVLAGEPVGAGRVPLADPEPEAVVQRELGEYQLLEKLGEGGMGAVYKARQTNLDRLVALKVLPKDRSENQVAIARFYREMRAVGRLSHPNIVQAFDAREIDGSPVLAMEYVEGLDLAKLVSAMGSLRIADACELVRQTAVGLQHAHEQGLVHRDVKPSNVMLSRRGTVKILDLGLALLGVNQPDRQEMTAAGTAMGTADYVSPEQVTDSHGVDIRADIYSLGCTLYKLLAGRAPFAGPENKNDVARMLAHVTQTPPPLAGVRSDVPPELASVVERMMAKDPSGRFATPAEVVVALAPFTAGCNLPALVVEAERRVGKPAAGPPHSATTGQLSASPVADTSFPLAPVLRGEGSGVRGVSLHQPEPAAQSARPPRDRHWVGQAVKIGLAAIAAGFLFFLLSGIVIRIRDKWGGEMVIKPPPGSTVIVEEDGKQVAQVPAPDKETKTPPEQPSTKPLTIGKPIERPKPVTLKLTPEPLNLPPGAPMSELALVARPAPLPGVRSWTIETRGHRGTIDLAYSPNGTQLLTAGNDGTIRILDAADGRLVRALVGASAPATWSPDGSLVAACGARNGINASHSMASHSSFPYLALTPKDGINIWDSKTCRILKTIRVNYPIHTMAWSSDGRLIATTIDGEPPNCPTRRTMISDVESGRCLHVLPDVPQSYVGIGWSPDGSVLAEASFLGVRRWHTRSHKLLPVLPLEYAKKCYWSPDGSLLLAQGERGSSRIWESDSGKLVREFNDRALGWSPDGKTIAVLSAQGEMALVDAATGGPKRKLDKLLTSPLEHLVWSPDAKLLAVRRGAAVSILDAESGQMRRGIVGHPSTILKIKWSPDETRLLVGARGSAQPLGQVRIFDARSGHQLRAIPDDAYHAEWSPDGGAIAAGSLNVTLWNAESGNAMRVLARQGNWFAWSPDGKRLARVQNPTNVQVFGTENGELLKTLGPKVPGCPRLLWSPDGKKLAAAGNGPPNVIWDVESGKVLGQVVDYADDTKSLAFSPDAAMLALGCNSGKIKLCDAASGQVVDTLHGHQGPVDALRWSSNGKSIVSGSADGTIREWDVHTGQVVRSISGIVPKVFSSGGSYVGWPHTTESNLPSAPCAQIWDTEKGEPQGTIVLLRDDAYLTVSPSGHYRGSPGVARQLIYVVQTDAGQETLTPEEFSQRYGWKNDPEKVSLIGAPEASGRP